MTWGEDGETDAASARVFLEAGEPNGPRSLGSFAHVVLPIKTSVMLRLSGSGDANAWAVVPPGSVGGATRVRGDVRGAGELGKGAGDAVLRGFCGHGRQ
jgi:hypothetical protein